MRKSSPQPPAGLGGVGIRGDLGMSRRPEAIKKGGCWRFAKDADLGPFKRTGGGLYLGIFGCDFKRPSTLGLDEGF